MEEDEGLFEISYSAVDVCDPNPAVYAFIPTPRLVDPEIQFEVEEEIKLEYDLEENEIEIKGPDPESLWQDIQTLGGFGVEVGQLVYIEPEEEPEEVEFKYEEGILKIEGYLSELKAVAKDASGNQAATVASPVFTPEEED